MKTQIQCLNYLIVEMAVLTRENNKTVIKILSSTEVDALIAKYEKAEAEAEAAKKEKLAQKSDK